MSAPVATNKKAYHNYFIEDKWECGIELKGSEVKSVRAGEVSFADAYVSIEKDEVWLYHLHIAPYAQASYLNPDPDRKRRLLMNAREIKRITSGLTQKGMTAIPTKIYFNARGFAKIEIGLGRGKKLFDKRDDIKRRESDRHMARASRR